MSSSIDYFILNLKIFNYAFVNCSYCNYSGGCLALACQFLPPDGSKNLKHSKCCGGYRFSYLAFKSVWLI